MKRFWVNLLCLLALLVTVLAGPLFMWAPTPVEAAWGSFSEFLRGYDGMYADVAVQRGWVYTVFVDTSGMYDVIATARYHADGSSFYKTTQASPAQDSHEPHLQVVDDTIYYVYTYSIASGNRGIHLATSDLDGTNWSTTEVIDRTYDNRWSEFQVVGSKVYYSWCRYVGSYWQLFTGRSDLDGSNFVETQQTSGSFHNYVGSMEVVDDDGKVYYAYTDNNTVNTAYANLDGTGWSSTDQGGVIYAKWPDLDVEGDKIYYVWSTYQGGYKALYTAYSNKDGTGWNYRKRHDYDVYYYPQVEVYGDTVYYAYIYQYGTHPDLWRGNSDLDGDNWWASGGTGTIGKEYPSMAIDPSTNRIQYAYHRYSSGDLITACLEWRLSASATKWGGVGGGIDYDEFYTGTVSNSARPCVWRANWSVVAAMWVDTSGVGTLSTFRLNDVGDLGASEVDSLSIDADGFWEPDVVHVADTDTGSIWAMAYSDDDDNTLIVKTIGISLDGTIEGILDTCVVEAADAWFGNLVSYGNGIVVLGYADTDMYAKVSTVSISDDGTSVSVIDSFISTSYSEDECPYPQVSVVNSDVLLFTSNNWWNVDSVLTARTIGIESDGTLTGDIDMELYDCIGDSRYSMVTHSYLGESGGTYSYAVAYCAGSLELGRIGLLEVSSDGTTIEFTEEVAGFGSPDGIDPEDFSSAQISDGQFFMLSCDFSGTDVWLDSFSSVWSYTDVSWLNTSLVCWGEDRFALPTACMGSGGNTVVGYVNSTNESLYLLALEYAPPMFVDEAEGSDELIGSENGSVTVAYDGTLWTTVIHFDYANLDTDVRAYYSEDYGVTWDYEEVVTGLALWSSASVVADGQNRVHCVYTAEGESALYYKVRSGDVWGSQETVVDVGGSYEVDLGTERVMVDSSGVPHVVFSGTGVNDTYPVYTNVGYCNRDGGAWGSCESVTSYSSGTDDIYPDIMLDSYDYVHVVHDGDDIKYTRRESGYSDWASNEESLPVHSGPAYLAVDATDDVHVAYGVSPSVYHTYRTNAEADWTSNLTEVYTGDNDPRGIWCDDNNDIHVVMDDGVDRAMYDSSEASWSAYALGYLDGSNYVQTVRQPCAGAMPQGFGVLLSYDTGPVDQFWFIGDLPEIEGIDTTPTVLYTEGGEGDLVVLTDTTPEFSAIYNDLGVATHYQVQVDDDSEFLSPYWDSTQTAIAYELSMGERCSDIVYDGPELQWHVPYYWRIRFWGPSGASLWAHPMFILNHAPSASEHMLCEAATNPSTVTDPTPEFSAMYLDDDTGDVALYYELEVGTDNDWVSAEMWDTGKTALGSSVTEHNWCEDISYAGSDLVGGTTYWWRIRFWDDDDGEGSWSTDVSYFTMTNTPQVTSVVATNVAGSSARLNGLLTYDTGVDCEYSFVYGYSATALDIATPWSGAGDVKSTGESFYQTVTGLDYGTTVYFQARCRGTLIGNGGTLSFTTLVGAAAVNTQAATDISTLAATMNGYLVEDGGEACEVWFQWGTVGEYWGYADTVGTYEAYGAYGVGNVLGQSFTVDAGGNFTVDAVALKLYREGAPGTIDVEIWTVDGNGNPDTGAGTEMVDGTYDGNLLTDDTAGEWIVVDLSAGSSDVLVASTSYAVVVRASSGDSSNSVHWMVDDAGSVYGSGDWCTALAGAWTSPPSGTETGSFALYSAYSSTSHQSGALEGYIFDEYLYSLSSGCVYRYRAAASNTSGTVYGSDVVFLTAPYAAKPSSLRATPLSSTEISLTWSKGYGSAWTRVNYKTYGYPVSYADGQVAYFGDGSSCLASGLTPGTTYYFAAWSWVPTAAGGTFLSTEPANIGSPYAMDSGSNESTVVEADLVWIVDDYYVGDTLVNSTEGLTASISDYVASTTTITLSTLVTGQSPGDEFYIQFNTHAMGTTRAGSVGGDDPYDLSDVGSTNWFLEPSNTALAFLPGRGVIVDAAGEFGMSVGSMFFFLAVLLASAVTFFAFLLTRSVLTTVLVVGGYFLLCMTLGIVPGWVFLMYLVVGLGGGYALNKAGQI